MSDSVVGVNEEKLINLANSIDDKALRLQKKFDELDSLVENLTSNFDCTSGIIFRDKYKKLSYNFKIVEHNILKYSDNLKSVVSNYKKIDNDAIDYFRNWKGENKEEK